MENAFGILAARFQILRYSRNTQIENAKIKTRASVVLHNCRIREDFNSLSEKCLYSEFSWSVFSRIWTGYGEILRISSYSVRMQENTEQKNSEYGHLLRSDFYSLKSSSDIESITERLYSLSKQGSNNCNNSGKSTRDHFKIYINS